MSLYRRLERFSFINRVGDPLPENIFELILRILFKQKKLRQKLIVGYTPTQVLLKERDDSPVINADIPWLWVRSRRRNPIVLPDGIDPEVRECYLGLFLAKLYSGEACFGKAYWFNREEVWFRTYAGEMRRWKWNEVRLVPAEAVDINVLYEPREKRLEERIAELELEKEELKTKISETVRENEQLQNRLASLEGAEWGASRIVIR